MKCLRLANRDMDIINCKTGESFVIDKEIFVTILSTKDGMARIALDLPENIRVQCLEVLPESELLSRFNIFGFGWLNR